MIARVALHAVVFDFGEVLVDEGREYGTWADWLGVPRHTFSAVLGATIARGEDHRRAFLCFRPDFDLEVERRRRDEAGLPQAFAAEDIYPDVPPCLERLRARGLLLGAVGNQPARSEQLLRALDLPLDWIATSAGWEVEKPAPAFFERIAAECRCPPGQIAYVGDRLDNDVRPALAAGMVAVFLRRGPWGYLQASDPEVHRAHVRIESLEELPGRLAGL
jgi:HAD superfamily hydrolase (TIGR01549 family)